MKKLMIMAVVASLGIAAQAKSWSFSSGNVILRGFDTSGAYTQYDFLGAGYDVYIIAADFVNSTPLDSTKANLISQDTFLTRVRNGQSYSKAAGTALLANTVTDANSYFSVTDVAINDSSYYYNAGYGAADTLYAFLIIEGDDAVFVSDIQGSTGSSIEFAVATYKTDILKDSTGTAAWSGNGWYAVLPVPEPTSGLLMLLGMAGLALKRRRA